MSVKSLENAYVALVAARFAGMASGTEDNADAYVATRDRRKTPVRVPVLDLITEVEDEVKTWAGYVCSLCEVVPLAPFRAGRRNGVDADTMAAFATLGNAWAYFEGRFPEAAEQMARQVERLLLRVSSITQERRPPAPLAASCPECGSPSVWRIETPGGVRAACSECRGSWGEEEWEDAHTSRTAG